MKAYTDLEQSKKLAEVLPLESADMHYNNASIKGINYVDEHRAELMEYNIAIKVLSKYTINPLFEVIPCWSLAALFGALPDESDIVKGKVDVIDDKYMCTVCIKEELVTAFGNNPIDACVEMILKLHELKML